MRCFIFVTIKIKHFVLFHLFHFWYDMYRKKNLNRLSRGVSIESIFGFDVVL